MTSLAEPKFALICASLGLVTSGIAYLGMSQSGHKSNRKYSLEGEDKVSVKVSVDTFCPKTFYLVQLVKSVFRYPVVVE